MKFFRLLILLSIPTFILLFAAQSCIKKNDPVEEDFSAGEDVAFTHGLLANVFDVVIDVASTSGDMTSKTSTILTPFVKIIFTDSLLNDGDGLEYYISFADIDTVAVSGGSQCLDERNRGGNIYLTQSSYFSDSNVIITAEMRDDATAHYVGGSLSLSKFIGLVTITKKGVNYTLNLTKGRVKLQTGWVSYETTQEIKFKKDNGPGIMGDSYSLTGNITGKNRNNEAFTAFVGIDLVKKLESVCDRIFTEGQIEVRNTVKDLTANINYDPDFNGTCDRVFKVSLIDGKSITYKVN